MSNTTITWQSPSNIALIKYWGKHGNQLPNNASLSLTLSQATTTTSLSLKRKGKSQLSKLILLLKVKKMKNLQKKLLPISMVLKQIFRLSQKIN